MPAATVVPFAGSPTHTTMHGSGLNRPLHSSQRALQKLPNTNFLLSSIAIEKIARKFQNMMLESEFNRWLSALSLRCRTSKLQPTFTQ